MSTTAIVSAVVETINEALESAGINSANYSSQADSLAKVLENAYESNGYITEAEVKKIVADAVDALTGTSGLYGGIVNSIARSLIQKAEDNGIKTQAPAESLPEDPFDAGDVADEATYPEDSFDGPRTDEIPVFKNIDADSEASEKTEIEILAHFGGSVITISIPSRLVIDAIIAVTHKK
jgi:hypothetical protein